MDLSLLDHHRDWLEPGNEHVELLRRHARQLIAQALEQERLEAEQVVPLRAGMWSAVFLLEPLGLVLKFPVELFEDDFLRLATINRIPVPRYVAAGKVSHQALGEAGYVLMEYLPRTLNCEEELSGGRLSAEELLQMGKDLGKLMAQMHRVPVGYIGNRQQTFATWGELAGKQFHIDFADPEETALYKGDLLRHFARIEATDYLRYDRGHLIHGDLNLSNVLMEADSRRLRAVLDPWHHLGGHPMYDLAYASLPWEHGMEYHRAVIESYRMPGGPFDPQAYFISLMVVAYWEEREIEDQTVLEKVRKVLEEYALPQIHF